MLGMVQLGCSLLSPTVTAQPLVPASTHAVGQGWTWGWACSGGMAEAPRGQDPRDQQQIQALHLHRLLLALGRIWAWLYVPFQPENNRVTSQNDISEWKQPKRTLLWCWNPLEQEMIPNGLLRYSQKEVIQGGMTSSPPCICKGSPELRHFVQHPGLCWPSYLYSAHLGRAPTSIPCWWEVRVHSWVAPSLPHSKSLVHMYAASLRQHAKGCWGAMVPWPAGKLFPAFPSKASFLPPVQALAPGRLQLGEHSSFPDFAWAPCCALG